METEFIMNIVLPSNYSSCLENEIKLLRPSMMYADKVILNSSEVNSLIKIYNQYGEDYKEVFIEERQSVIETLKEAVNENPGKMIDIKGAKIRGEDFLGVYIQEMEEGIAQIDKKDKNFQKILPYILSGDIQLQEYDMILEPNEEGEVVIDSERQDQIYIANLLTDAVGYEYYTLFDDYLFETVDKEVKKIANISNPNKFKHAGFIYQVIPTMPNFAKAEIDEIIDIRKELEKPLDRFRRKVYIFSDEISSLPWNKGFNEECKRIYETTIKESLDEIEELSKKSSIIKNLVANFSQMNILELAGGITASVLAGEYWAVMASLLTATKLSKEVVDYYERAKEAKKNHMYFYYEANRRLGKIGSMSIVGVVSVWIPPHYCVCGEFYVLIEKYYFFACKENLLCQSVVSV